MNMYQKGIYNYCKDLGCCEACCRRYLGIKTPKAYSGDEFVIEFSDQNQTDSQNDLLTEKKDTTDDNKMIDNKDKENNADKSVNGDEVQSKKRKLNICVSCLGILQEENWLEGYQMVKEALDKKGYDCNTFACALSSPIATLLREKSIILHLKDKFPGYDAKNLTPLKEAWKWSFGVKLSGHINKKLDSGAVSPLLITVTMDYVDDLQELEILKTVSPQLFEERSKQKRRFVTEFTRRCVEQALEQCTLEAARVALSTVCARALCVSVACAHAPVYLAGRYIKLSRNLPQTPWILAGKRVLPSSVQEIIFEPLIKYYNFDAEDADRKLKIIAAGREDVDVRCLGEGRPFAIEVMDPTRNLTQEELAAACKKISESGEVIVRNIIPIDKEDLIQLKKGEETKSKSYKALCIKLDQCKHDDPKSPVHVTQKDIDTINTYRNTDKPDTRIIIQQKTPIRVLHRRPLLTRTREILDLTAKMVPGYPQLFTISVHTTAGTYVKEWCHGELSRSRPSLSDVLDTSVDMLALDVTAVHLIWPPVK